MEDRRLLGWMAGLGCAALILVVAVVAGALFLVPKGVVWLTEEGEGPALGAEATRIVAPTLTPAPSVEAPQPTTENVPQVKEGTLASLYDRANPGVVSIQVYVSQGGMTGQGSGSGFILDEEGHIVTNNHVVAKADEVTVVFHNGVEARAEMVGTDVDSDLAVIQVDEMPESAHALPVGNSDQVEVGDWLVAIGNPFSLGGSMSLGIVSAVGRAIPSGATPFRIPQAIQTDAAINPGNSGGPLLNLEGQVIGVNAQIASGGTQANAGVGFAIPSNVVRRVVPALVEEGRYEWPWLGVTGGDVDLTIMDANDLSTQLGAYIAEVAEGGPAEEAGLQGASGVEEINGYDIPVGGDVIVAADGEPIEDFNDLLAYVAFRRPGDTIELTILRNGERQRVTVELTARPDELER